MKKNLFKIICVVLALVLLSACGEEDVKVSEEVVMLSVTELNMKLGETKTLEVLDFDGKVTWSSSNPSVAKVSDKGEVSAVAMGSVAITADLDNGMSKICKVNIQQGESKIESIKVGFHTNMNSDFTHNVSASGNTARLKAECVPENHGEVLAWTSSDEAIATVSNDGVVTLHKNGNVTINATAVNGISGSCIVRIKGASNANTGSEQTLTPPESGDTNAVSTVEESDGKVPEVDSKETSRFTAPIPSSDPTAKSRIIISDSKAYLQVGESLKLTYDVTNIEDKKVSWTSSDKAVAIVTENGRIVAVGEGRCVVSAVTADGAVASCNAAVGDSAIKELKEENK